MNQERKIDIKNKKWIIYKHVNKITKKIYIGQTSCVNPENRWKSGEGYKNQEFYKDIEKYGWDNFTHEIIESNITTQEEADNKEAYYITLNNSNSYHLTGKGYNVSPGGIHYWKSRMSLLTDDEKDMLCNWFKQYHQEGYKNSFSCLFPRHNYKLIYSIATQLGLIQLYRSLTDLAKINGRPWSEIYKDKKEYYDLAILEARKKMN